VTRQRARTYDHSALVGGDTRQHTAASDYEIFNPDAYYTSTDDTTHSLPRYVPEFPSHLWSIAGHSIRAASDADLQESDYITTVADGASLEDDHETQDADTSPYDPGGSAHILQEETTDNITNANRDIQAMQRRPNLQHQCEDDFGLLLLRHDSFDIMYFPGLTRLHTRKLLELKGFSVNIVARASTNGSDAVLKATGSGVRKGSTGNASSAAKAKSSSPSRQRLPSGSGRPQITTVAKSVIPSLLGFACPLSKHNPQRYEHVDGPCVKTPFTEFKYVKDHIWKYHSIEKGCPYCSTTHWNPNLSIEEQFHEHLSQCKKVLRQGQKCHPNPLNATNDELRKHGRKSLPELLTVSQTKALRTDCRKIPKGEDPAGESSWFALYRAFYPGEPLPTNPCKLAVKLRPTFH
jgi:hypothetical protein